MAETTENNQEPQQQQPQEPQAQEPEPQAQQSTGFGAWLERAAGEE